MCGIVGFNWEDKTLAKRMADSLVHRGPDEVAYFTDSGLSLGMRRLSIIDLSPRIYPIKNENENIFLIFNGEIYNFRELREKLREKGHIFKTNCDGEVIVHAYEQYGEGFLNMLNGMFAICIYDSRSKELILARDRIGIKPLYYHLENGNFAFASEIKSILAVNSIKREVNITALNHYFALRYNPLEETMFKGIMRLLPGHFIRFDLREKTMSIGRYWDINLMKEEHHPRKYYENQFLALLKDSVERQMISDVPLGAYLSGGIDSSAIVAMMAKIRKEQSSNAPLRTYTIGFSGGEKVNENRYAKEVSELFGTEHKDFILSPDVAKLLPRIVWHTDEPMADPALIPTFLLSESAKKTSTVVLTGDGGDELFAGYDHYRFMNGLNKASKFPFFRSLGPAFSRMIPLKTWDRFYKHTSDLGKDAYKRSDVIIRSFKDDKAKAYYHLLGIFGDEERTELLKGRFGEQIDYSAINKEFFLKRSGDFMKRLQYFDLKRMLGDSFLMKTDRMTMAASVESRVPLLDHRLVELAFEMPTRYKIQGTGKTKLIMKHALKKELPRSILYRKKQSFHMPIENWLNKDLQPMVDDLLNTTKIFHEGVLNYEYVKKVKENYESGKLYYARQLWTLMSFELWYRQFILQENNKETQKTL